MTKALWLLSVLLLSGGLRASESSDAPQAVEVTFATPQIGELNIALITHDLVTRSMSHAEWHEFVEGVQLRLKDWMGEYENASIKRFLDDRLIQLAPSVTSGKGKNLKEFCKWLALYAEYSEPVPKYIRDISDDDKRWIQTELSDFDWDRTALKIKEKHKK